MKVLLTSIILFLVTLPSTAQQIISKIDTDHHAKILQVKISPNNEYIATASLDRTVKIWGLNDGELKRTLYGHKDAVRDLDFSPDSKKLISGDRGGKVFIWKVKDGSRVKETEDFTNLPDKVYGVSYSPNNYNVSITGNNTNFFIDNDRTIPSLNNETNNKERYSNKSLRAHKDNIFKALFHPTENIVATCSADNSIKIWDIKSGFNIKTINFSGEGLVFDISFSPNGKRLYALPYSFNEKKEKFINVYNTKSYKLIRKLGPFGGADEVSISPDNYVAAAPDGNHILFWDLNESNQRKLKGHKGYDVSSINFSADGQYLVSSSGTEIILWDMWN